MTLVGGRAHLHQAGREENDGVDQANDPFVSAWLVDFEFFGERQVGAVGSSLVPSLRGGANSAEADGVPQHLGTMPLVLFFVLQSVALVIGKAVHRVKPFRVSRDKSGIGKHVGMPLHAVESGPFFGVGDDLLFRFSLGR